MHDTSVAPSPAPTANADDAPLDKSLRLPLLGGSDLSAYEELFLHLCFLRGASAEAMSKIFFERVHGLSERSSERVISALVHHGYLVRIELPKLRSIYRLTARAIARFPSTIASVSTSIRRTPSVSVAERLWLRSTLIGHLCSDGFTVGRGPREVMALRRFLLDEQKAWLKTLSGKQGAPAAAVYKRLREDEALAAPTHSRCVHCSHASDPDSPFESCPRCGGASTVDVPRRLYRCDTCARFLLNPGGHDRDGWKPCTGGACAVDFLDVDVAWKKDLGGAVHVFVLLVDDPTRALPIVLADVPARVFGRPKIKVVLRTCDRRSQYDLTSKRFLNGIGPRHAALLRAFSEDPGRNAFPFSVTTEVIEYRPEIQLSRAHYRGVS